MEWSSLLFCMNDERVAETYIYRYGAFKMENWQLNVGEKRKNIYNIMILVCTELIPKVFDKTQSA